MFTFSLVLASVFTHLLARLVINVRASTGTLSRYTDHFNGGLYSLGDGGKRLGADSLAQYTMVYPDTSQVLEVAINVWKRYTKCFVWHVQLV